MFDVVTIGTATRDMYLIGVDYDLHHKDTHAITGEAVCLPLGSKVYVKSVEFTTGGGGTNAAVTFAREGFRVGCIAEVGGDIAGEELIKELKKEKVETDFIFHDKKKKTAYSVILLTSSGERTILSFQGAGTSIRADYIPWRKIKTAWIYLDSLHGNMPLIRGIVEYKKNNPSVRIAWNPSLLDLNINKKVLRELLEYIDIFISNQEEASFLTGKSYDDEKAIFGAFDKLIPGIAVMTKGPQGVVVSDGNTLWRAGTYKEKKVIDRTGAGDAFASGFVAGLMLKVKENKAESTKFSDEMIEYALRLGSANATSKIEGIGAKYGILKKREFENDKRWRKFLIKKIKL